MSDAASLTGLPLAVDEDILNANASFGNYAQGADTLLVPRYANPAIRDTANAAGTTEGQMCVTGAAASGLQTIQQYDGNRWWDVDSGYLLTFGDLGFTSVNLRPGAAVSSFTIPQSGKVMIEVGIYASCTVTTSDLLVSWSKAASIPEFQRHITGPNFANTAITGAMVQMNATSGTLIATAVTTGSLLARTERVVVAGAPSGDQPVSLIVGVNTVGTAITIDPRSWIIVRRVA